MPNRSGSAGCRSAHADGTLEDVLGNLGVTILSVMKLLGFENSAAVDPTWIRAYGAHFKTKADCTGAINFPLDFATGKWYDSRPEAPARPRRSVANRPCLPRACATGDSAGNGARPFPRGVSGGAVTEIEGAGHFCQEDQPLLLVALVEQFIQLT